MSQTGRICIPRDTKYRGFEQVDAVTALHEHIRVQSERATMLTRIMDLLNVAIHHPDRADLVTALVEAGQDIATDREENLQDVNLPKDAAA